MDKRTQYINYLHKTNNIVRDFVNLKLDYDVEQLVIALALSKVSNLFSRELDITTDAIIDPDSSGSKTAVKHAQWLINESAKAKLTYGEFQLMVGKILVMSAEYLMQDEIGEE